VGRIFFEVTKAFHNALHGGRMLRTRSTLRFSVNTTTAITNWYGKDAEFTIIHDPQPAALIEARREKAGHWIWRCHIDLSRTEFGVWGIFGAVRRAI